MPPGDRIDASRLPRDKDILAHPRLARKLRALGPAAFLEDGPEADELYREIGWGWGWYGDGAHGNAAVGMAAQRAPGMDSRPSVNIGLVCALEAGHAQVRARPTPTPSLCTARPCCCSRIRRLLRRLPPGMGDIEQTEKGVAYLHIRPMIDLVESAQRVASLPQGPGRWCIR